MGYTYKGYFRYITSFGDGGIGISVVSFKPPDGPLTGWRLDNILNDQDITGALYSAASYGSVYLLLPDLLRIRGESENHGKFHDLRYLELYGERNKASISMSFSVEKYSNGKFVSMYALRDEQAVVRSIDLVNNSYVWNTALDLKLPNATLLADGNRVAGK